MLFVFCHNFSRPWPLVCYPWYACHSRHVRLFLSCSLKTLTFPCIPAKSFPYAYVYRSLAYRLSPLTGLRVHDLSSMVFLCVSARLDKFAIYGQCFTVPQPHYLACR
jgi:hypothetical protein